MKKLTIAIVCVSKLALAEVVSVNDIKVSATETSATAAQEKALAEAHRIAAQRILDSMGRSDVKLPSDNELMAIASGMSIVKEKNTGTNYMAIVNIQFDTDKLLGSEVPQNMQPDASSGFAFKAPQQNYKAPAVTSQIELTITYSSMQEFLKLTDDIKSSGVTVSLTPKAISQTHAVYLITIGGDEVAWKNHMREQLGWNLVGTNGKFTLSTNNS